MAHLTILYWRDIPSQVIVKAGRAAAKRELPERFIRAIDGRRDARGGPAGRNAYLGGLAAGESPAPAATIWEAEASASAARIEAEI